MRNKNTHYYIKNYKTQATDHRKDQEPVTTTTDKTTTDGEHPSDPLPQSANTSLQTTEDKQLLEEYIAPDFEVQIANGSLVPVRKQVLPRFFIGGKIFEKTFMILPTMGNILIGMSFFKKHSVTLDLANNVVKFPDITLQLKPERGRYKIQMIELRTTQKTVIQPDHQLIVPVLAERDLGTIQGTVETFPTFERKTQLLMSPAMAQITEMKSHVQIINLTIHTITVSPNTTVATFRIMTPNQAKNLQPMSTEQLTLITKYPDEANNVLN